MANVTHSTLTGADLHEPKGVASANSGEVYVANGGGSGAWTAMTQDVFMNKHIAGLTWSNAADASNDITVAAGTCRDVTNTEDMTLAASITKRIDASWAVGDNQGGFDTGSVAATGVYHLFLIKRTDTDVVDAIFSATLSGPTMPTNYTKSRRIGSIYRQAGVNVACTVIEIEGGGIEVWRTTPVASGNQTWVAASKDVTLAQFPNNTTGLEAIFSYTVVSVTNPAIVSFTPTTTTTAPPAGMITLLDATIGGDLSNVVNGAYGRCHANSGAVRFWNSTSNGTLNVTTIGWKDPRRS